MSRVSLDLLSAMPPALDCVGTPVRAAGWHGPTRGLHTVSIRVHCFRGRVAIQGSQVPAPAEADWFPVPYPAPFSGLPFIEYPRAAAASLLPLPAAPVAPIASATFGANPNLRGGETSTWGFSFRINCLWLRAVVTRSYLVPAWLAASPVGLAGLVPGSGLLDAAALLGAVDSILLNC